MAAMYPGQVSAVQVGSFFVKQYYEIIQQTPQYGYQFYSDASTAIRIDGDIEQTAKSAVQINNLLIALNFTSIEVKTIHSLNSWDGGVLVMVSGFVQIKDYASRRRFVQTFFLAPQEKGFFVLNDIFHFLEEEVTLQPSIMALHHNDYEDNQLGHDNYDNNHLVHDNYESASNSMSHHKHLVHDNYDSASNSMNHHVSDVIGYAVEEELQSNEYVSHIDEQDAREYVPKHHIDEREYVHVDESDYGTTLNENDIDTIDKYSIPDPYQLQQQLHVSNVDEKVDEVHVEELVASFPSAVSMTRESVSTREFVEERPKLTYASILRLAKAQPDNSVPQAAPVRKAAPVVSEVQSSTPQQAYPEDFTYEAVEESANDYDGIDSRNRWDSSISSLQRGGRPRAASSDDAEQGAEQQFRVFLIQHSSNVDLDIVLKQAARRNATPVEVKSVYVGNLSASITAADLQHEFKNFGRIKPHGVSVRSRKDSGGFYAFVEFEDATSVQTALQASPIMVNGQQIYVEERKPNSGLSRVGGGRGRGRGRSGYQPDATRGRFGNRGYNSGGRSRGNGVLSHQDRGILGTHGNQSDWPAY